MKVVNHLTVPRSLSGELKIQEPDEEPVLQKTIAFYEERKKKANKTVSGKEDFGRSSE